MISHDEALLKMLGGKAPARAMKRKLKKAKAKALASAKPWDVVILNVDPGEKCGVSLYVRGVLRHSAQIDGYDHAEIAALIQMALVIAQHHDIPLVLVLEQPPGGGKAYPGRNLHGAASVMGSRKVWKRVWLRTPNIVKRRVVDVYPPTWRAVAFAGLGKHFDVLEKMIARSILTRALGAFGAAKKVGADECAAICIGKWSACAGEVAAVLPAKLRRVA